MYYEIKEFSTAAESGLSYVLVHFWRDAGARLAGSFPLLAEEFLMQLENSSRQIVTDARGRYQLADGSFVDPIELDEDAGLPQFRYEERPGGVMERVQQNIEQFVQMAEVRGLAGSLIRKKNPVIRDRSDPHGILQHADAKAIASLKGESLSRVAPRAEIASQDTSA